MGLVLLLLKNMNKYILIAFNIDLSKLQVLQIEIEKFTICETDTVFWLQVDKNVEVEVGDIYDKNTQTFLKPYTLVILAERKVEVVKIINDCCGFLITTEYPIWKQMNITNGLDTDVSLAEMQAFIQSKRDKARELRSQVETIDNVKDLEELVENLENLFN